MDIGVKQRMADSAKTMRFRELFNTWRSENAADEMKYLINALIIQEFVDSSDLNTIKNHISHGEVPDTHFGASHKTRSFGALVYTKLVLEYYHENLDPASHELTIVKNIKTNIEHLYENPSNDLSIHVNGMLDNLHHWLDQYVILNPNKELAKQTLLSVYTALTFLQVKLHHIEVWKIGVMTINGLDHDKLKKTTRALLKKTENKIHEIEHILNPTEDNDEEGIDEITTIDDFLNQTCLNIIKQEKIPLLEKIKRINAQMLHVDSETKKLISHKEESANIQDKMDKVLALMTAIDENEVKITDRKDAKQLVDEHRALVLELIDTLPTEALKQEWRDRIRQLDSSEGLINSAKKLGSKVLHYPTIVTRFMAAWTPQFIKSGLDRITPETIDSECKKKLKALATEQFQTLRSTNLEAINQKRKELIVALVGEDESTVSLFLELSKFDLENSSSKIVLLNQVMTDYAKLCAIVLYNQKKLKDVALLGVNLDDFLTKYDGFFVQVSLFLSRICSFFKTTLAAKVEEVTEIKGELSRLCVSFVGLINESKSKINMDPNISPEIKNAILTQLMTEEEPAVIHPPAPHPADNETTYFHSIQTFFSQVKQPQMIDEEGLGFSP